MRYDIYGAANGEISLVTSGQEQLAKLAMDHLKNLHTLLPDPQNFKKPFQTYDVGEEDWFYSDNNYEKTVQSLLGISIYKPPSEQKAAHEKFLAKQQKHTQLKR